MYIHNQVSSNRLDGRHSRHICIPNDLSSFLRKTALCHSRQPYLIALVEAPRIQAEELTGREKDSPRVQRNLEKVPYKDKRAIVPHGHHLVEGWQVRGQCRSLSSDLTASNSSSWAPYCLVEFNRTTAIPGTSTMSH